MAGCHRIRQFSQQFSWEQHSINRPHVLLWLAKCYAIPASMYACQVWGTRFMKKGSESDSLLQTAHTYFLKGVHGVKRTSPYWAVLRECWQEPSQFHWIRSAAKSFNSLLCGYSGLLKKIMHANIAPSSSYKLVLDSGVHRSMWGSAYIK